MYTIYQNATDERYDFDSFREQMIQICNEHRDTNRALAFAFILYDFENPHLTKILKDREYWIALDKISGEYLTVFSLNYKDQESVGIEVLTNISGSKELTDIPTSLNPSVGTNKLIEKYFGSKVIVNYPAILFFQVDNYSVIDSLLIDLKEEEIERGFLELKGYLKKAVSALEKITPENKQNVAEIFDCLERELKSARTIRKIKRFTKNAGEILGLVSSIKSIV